MKGNYTIIIQSNTIGGSKVAYTITEQKLYKLRQILEPEMQRQRKKEDCSSITLDQFFNGSVD